MKTDLSAAFYSTNQDTETLAKRVTLLEEQASAARQEKDNLLKFLKSELSEHLEIRVGYWIQGSFKNHTAIRPVRIGDEFDVDVGVYLFTNAEVTGLKASDAKDKLRQILFAYCLEHNEAKLEEPKPNCERVSFSGGFHIDLPLYYFDEKKSKCRLATQNNGWIDSDPKSLQTWFSEQINHLSDSEKARLRRVIKALKTWACLKNAALPSVAISCFVARNYAEYQCEEEAVWTLAQRVADHLTNNGRILSPLNGDDLIGASDQELDDLRRKCYQLQKVLQAVKLSNSIVMSHQLWSIEFEHTFPPLESLTGKSTLTNLPAKTTPPRISVKTGNGSPEQVIESVTVYLGDYLYFRVSNSADYPPNSEVIWMVRNTDKDASLKNDLGHKQTFTISDTVSEHCGYRGSHYMECTVLSSGQIVGVSVVSVNIRAVQRAPRNPPKKRFGPRR